MKDMTEKDYREAYQKEHQKCADLAARIADLESRNEELEWKLGRIKNNPLWKATGPLRRVMHWGIRQGTRVASLGSPKGILQKAAYKKREREAMKRYGTMSYPDTELAEKQRAARFPRMVTFSILVPLYNTPRNYLVQALDSCLNQTYGNWELCLADGSDEDHGYVETVCREYMEKAPGKVVYQKLAENKGIAGNTNECLKLATGDYIGLFDHDDILHPGVLFEYVKAINEQGADYLYCDETTFKNNDVNKMLTMHFKPDFAPDNLRANNYICHFSVFARELLDGTELFREKYDGSQDHDMILRLTDKAKCIVHIPKLLYYWRNHKSSVASGIGAKPYAVASAKGAVAEHLRKHGYDHFQITSTKAFETIFRIRYEIYGDPKISIIIANKDHIEDLRRCVTSILEKSTYENYEIIIVENNSQTQVIKAYYRSLTETGPEGKVKVAEYKSAFNYSAVNNFGASQASGEYLLLLNNDTEVITVNWMEELLMYAQREDVGAVGAKLLYPDKTIQHAGVVLGLGAHRTAGHSHYKQHRQNLGYMGRLCYAQDVSAVTGACLLVKKSLFTEVGGLDESFAVSLNDVDFCLKLREKKLLNVFTPFAELFHYESQSRGLDDSGERADRYERESGQFREKWKTVLEQGDPYYNPNFTLDRSDFSLSVAES